jgi:hypothetical protein
LTLLHLETKYCLEPTPTQNNFCFLTNGEEDDYSRLPVMQLVRQNTSKQVGKFLARNFAFLTSSTYKNRFSIMAAGGYVQIFLKFSTLVTSRDLYKIRFELMSAGGYGQIFF